MKHLNRIIFINSASMRYEELELDGNIHLSGFSGAGKTTVERAILYFFTADQRNLGIDLNSQETFVQHYFASGDSHIVYEVKKDDGAFCVILTNSENRIQYAFVDSPYRKEWVVDPVSRMVSSSWSEITKNIPQHIDRDLVINIKDYIEILWGCHRDHRYSKYMLAESKGYDNLLKSLKNVFLHSGFSHDGLKTNIVCSLSDSNPSINLVQLRSRLQDYLAVSEDLQMWYKVSPKGENKTRQLAKEIIDNYYSYIEKLKKIHSTLCCLQYAVDNASKSLPLLEKSKSENKALVKQFTEEIKKIRMSFDNEKEETTGRIAVIKDKLGKIASLKKKYTNINDIIGDVATIPTIEVELRTKEELLQKLKNANLSIEDKYKSMALDLKESYQKIVDEINSAIEKRRKQSEESKDAAEKDKDSALKKTEEIFAEQSSTINKALTVLRGELMDISKSVARVEATSFFAKEIQEKKDEISCLEKEIVSTSADITIEKGKYQTVKEEGLANENRINSEYFTVKDKYDKEKEEHKSRLQEIDSILSRYSDSLYSWLQEEKEGWQSNIGKVIDGRILYRTDLHPEHVPDTKDDSFYGIRINEDNIESQPFSPEDYEKERKTINARIDEIHKILREKTLEKDDLIKRSKEEYGKKLSSIRENIAKLELDNSARSNKIIRIREYILDLQEKAKSEKERQLNELHAKEAKKNEEIANKNKDLSQATTDKDNSIKTIMATYNESVGIIIASLSEFVSKREIEKTEEKGKYDKQVAALEGQKQQELSGQGVDTNRITILSNEASSLSRRLKGLNELKITVEKYKEDKSEYLDHEQEFVLELQKLKIAFNNSDQELEKIVKIKNAELGDAQSKVDECEANIKQINKDLEEYNNKRSFYANAFAADGHIEPQESGSPIGELINDYRDLIGYKVENINDLRKLVNRFNGLFKANIFNLPQGLTIDEDYLKYAKNLDDIINTGTIDEYSIGQNGVYIKTLQVIRMSVDNLLKRKATVEGVISELDREFRSAKLPSVIQEIRLRRADIRDELYDCLLSIYNFVESNDAILPGVSLWVSQSEFDKVRIEMHDLLSSFVKILFKPGNNEREEFTLEDMFSIEFRITENGQTQGWLSQIPKVIGSTGTGIMIKMLLNIMLISISKKKTLKKEDRFFLHCILDESENLPPEYIRDILDFCTDRGIYLILGSPSTLDPISFKRNYELFKDDGFRTRVQLLTERQDFNL
ncbi:MAG: ATP-binding protein [Prevotella sp.]|nr:ATP-binding protein [Prevotella sp.]